MPTYMCEWRGRGYECMYVWVMGEGFVEGVMGYECVDDWWCGGGFGSP